MDKMKVKSLNTDDASIIYLPDKNDVIYWINVDKEFQFIVNFDEVEYYFELYHRDGLIFYGDEILHNISDTGYECPYCEQKGSIRTVRGTCPVLSKNIKGFVDFFKTKSNYRLRAINELGSEILSYDEAFKRLGFPYDEKRMRWIDPKK